MLIMGAVCKNLIPITLFWRKPYGKIKVPTGVSTPKKQKLSDVKDSSSSNTFPGIHSWHDDGIDNLSYKEDGVPVIAGESNNAVYKEDDVKWIKATYFQDDKPPVVTVIESYLSSEDPENKIASLFQQSISMLYCCSVFGISSGYVDGDLHARYVPR